DCWAIPLQRGYATKRNLFDKSIIVDDFLNGVEAAYQASGKGINRIRNASTFMKNYAKEMKVHRLPRGDDASDHEEIFRPMDMDCHLITFEKFSIHRLLLRSYDVMDEIECCQVQDPQGVEWGTNGFIMMEQHKCLIKSIVELKVYKCFQKRSTTLKCIFIHEYLCRGHEYPQPS
ncbi:LOW QUALITY PROTEIN: hypothetical protein HID58_056281, partial [Brassica napus]